MSGYLQFLLLGLGTGAVYALLALGLVLKFRTAGVVDFAHGAVAMYAAYVFLSLRTEGDLQLPWVLLPHEIALTDGGMATAPSFAITVVVAVAFGLVTYALVYHPLRQASALARVAASVGLMISLQAMAALNFGTYTAASPPILPADAVDVLGALVPADRLYLAGIAVVVGAALAVTYRSTRFGLASRAAAANETGAAVTGLSAPRIGAQNWMLATVLAAVAGVLILPITTLAPGTYTLFIIPALAVALCARFTSFGVTVAAGLGLGMLQSEITKLQTTWQWLPNQGLQEGVPLLLIIVATVVLAGRLPARGTATVLRNPSIGRPARPGLAATAGGAACIVALLFSDRVYGTALLISLTTFCICLSVVVITGYVGQIALAQNAFAGIAGYAVARLSADLGLGFPISLLLAAALAAVVGIVIGLPAVRIRGVNLAVITLSAAVTLDALVFSEDRLTGGYQGMEVQAPTLFGIDLGIAGDDYPRLAFGILVVVVVMAVAVAVGRLRSTPAGRAFLAVRSNEHAAAAIGIDVARTKLLGFGLAAFIAGVGGALVAYQSQVIKPENFTVWTSLTILAIAYVGGVGRVSGALAAGFMLATGGLVPTFLDSIVEFGTYQTFIGGVLMIVVAIANPDGMATDFEHAARSALRLLRLGGASDRPATVTGGAS